MKILYIENIRIPTEKAHGIQITKMCEAFGKGGADLELILPTRKNKELEKVDPFLFYGVEKNFKIKKLFSLDPVFLMKFPQGIYIKFQALFFIISLFFFFLFKKNKKEYIFYTRDEYLLPILQLFSKKVVWEGHNLSNNHKKYFSFWKKCQKVIVISGALKKDLTALGLGSEKILVAHDGVDLEKFSISDSKENIRQKLNLPINKKIILYVGHFYKWKGVQVLADVARELKDCLVVFVGGQDDQFENFKEKNNLDNIIYTGYRNQTEIPSYLQSADILVLPNSKNDIKSKYTSPLKLFEYMSSGVPIIASDLDSLKDVLNEDNAVFFEPDNSSDLSLKIQNILDNESVAKNISEQTLEDVQKYTWQKRVENIIKFIK
jgi:glycosyltransferase involved in cell wall biosynthesis